MLLIFSLAQPGAFAHTPVVADSHTVAAAAAAVAADNIAAAGAAVSVAEAAAVAATDIAAEAVAEAGSAAEKADLDSTKSGRPVTEERPDPATCFHIQRKIY